jgi:hypothetical protein
LRWNRRKPRSAKSFALARFLSARLSYPSGSVVEAAYEDGVTISYPYFTEQQFQISLELLGKSMGQSVSLNYKQVVDHSLLDEIGRPGMNRPG